VNSFAPFQRIQIESAETPFLRGWLSTTRQRNSKAFWAYA
jgi:hypothetical protein